MNLNLSMTVVPLLAEFDRFQAMRGRLKPGATVDYTSQILVMVVIALVIVAVVFAVRYFNAQRSKSIYAPLGLFQELCRVHRLDRGQQRLLRELATSLELEHPSRLFLEPQLFETVAHGDQFAIWQTHQRRSQLDALRVRLFSDHLDLLTTMGA